MSEILSLISKSGTSIWLDDLSRERMVKGGKSRFLPDLIAQEFVVGVTTNPAIFSAAITNSTLYSDDIAALALKGNGAEEIIAELTTSDVARACDYFNDVYQRSEGVDGRVSIEVDPRLARDTQGTIAQARLLWKKISKPNLLIKVPATIEGLPAIRTLISEGISVNVTIIFSVARYRDVLDAFLSGLEDRASNNLPISNIHSVASFFVSRVDTEIDARLRSAGISKELEGRAAIANARLAYEHFLTVKNSQRWKNLEGSGAAIQRPLWASTGVKDPAYPQDLYVSELVAPLTVNTMPETTLIAVRDSGNFHGDSISSHFDSARSVLDSLLGIGIDIDEVAAKLENEGIDKFIKPWLQLIAAVETLCKK